MIIDVRNFLDVASNLLFLSVSGILVLFRSRY